MCTHYYYNYYSLINLQFSCSSYVNSKARKIEDKFRMNRSVTNISSVNVCFEHASPLHTLSLVYFLFFTFCLKSRVGRLPVVKRFFRLICKVYRVEGSLPHVWDPIAFLHPIQVTNHINTYNPPLSTPTNPVNSSTRQKSFNEIYLCFLISTGHSLSSHLSRVVCFLFISHEGVAR